MVIDHVYFDTFVLLDSETVSVKHAQHPQEKNSQYIQGTCAQNFPDLSSFAVIQRPVG